MSRLTTRGAWVLLAAFLLAWSLITWAADVASGVSGV